MFTSNLLHQVLLTLHLVGLALGLGGSAVADLSFVRTLRMGDQITAETVKWMRFFSTVIWIGLSMLAASGIGLFFLDTEKYLTSPGFKAKMIFVVILTINGYFLNYYVTARLTTFNFTEHYQRRGASWKARKLSFICGAVSGTTWYAVLGIAMFKNVVRLPFMGYVGAYVLVLGGAIVSSLLMEQKLMPKVTATDTIDKIASRPLSSIAIPSAPVYAKPPIVASSAVAQPVPIASPIPSNATTSLSKLPIALQSPTPQPNIQSFQRRMLATRPNAPTPAQPVPTSIGGATPVLQAIPQGQAVTIAHSVQ